jgi:hypothetical protein
VAACRVWSLLLERSSAGEWAGCLETLG